MTGRNSVLGLCDFPQRITRLTFISLVINLRDIKFISQCIHLLEQHEEDLTQWYFSDQNENLMSWLCVERVLDENERGKLEHSLCFPSPSLLPRIFHCRYLKPFSLKTELAYIPYESHGGTLSVFLNFRLSKCFNLNAGRLLLFAAGGQYHRNNKTGRGKEMGVIMKLKKNGHKDNGITV